MEMREFRWRAKHVAALVFFTVLSSLTGCHRGAPPETELTVSAAASLLDAMEDLKAAYEEETGVNVNLNVGSSGALRRQIEQGAPVDVFVSASVQHVEELVEQGKIEGESVVPLLTNTLVLITPASATTSVKSFHDLTDDEVERIAVAFPDSVPAGQYARESLEHLNLWDVLYDKFVFAKDVRQVLSYVEGENAEAGFVYKSDVSISSKVKVAAEAHSPWHQPIVYPAGIVASTDHKEEAEAFLIFLQSREAETVFKQYGFSLRKK